MCISCREKMTVLKERKIFCHDSELGRNKNKKLPLLFCQLSGTTKLDLIFGVFRPDK